MLATGARLGPYVVTGTLGQGGMGAVYRAKDASGAEAALKVLVGDLANDPRYVERFKREAQAAEAVTHRNVVRCLGSGEDAGTLWIAFELVPGGSLKDLVRARGKLPWREVARLGVQVARGLAAIHAKGLVHRDMKPANVLLDATGTAKVGDLGLARGLVGKQTLTMSGELVGTFEYVAPEQTEHAKVDFRADLYSFGAVLYELVTGRPPFTGAGLALIAQHISAVAHPPRELAPDLPDAFDALIRRLLAKQPVARGESALAVAAELENLATSAGPGRARALVAGAAVTALVAVAAAVPLLRTPPKVEEVAAVATRTTVEPPESDFALDAEGKPRWWRLVAEEDRPASLPEGVSFGGRPGEYVNQKDGSILVYVPAVEYQMGEDLGAEDGNKNPPHRVSLSAFFIGKYELTNRLYRAFREERSMPDSKGATLVAEATDAKGAAWREDPLATWRVPDGKKKIEDGLLEHPVVQVTYEDAQRYCEWAGLRLPTEAEWECAATWDRHARRKCPFPWLEEQPRTPTSNLRNKEFNEHFGKRDDRDVAGHHDGAVFTGPVGSFPHVPSPYGTFDMLGNVWEICADAFIRHLHDEPEVNPCPLEPEVPGTYVARGNAFEVAPENGRVVKRARHLTGDLDLPATSALGFRVARSAN